jgi:hypothetical protein
MVLSNKFVADELYYPYRYNPVAPSAIISIGLEKLYARVKIRPEEWE